MNNPLLNDFQSNNCPHCQEDLIKEELYNIVLDDDIEDALNQVYDKLDLCDGCEADQKSDFNRM